MSYAPPQPECSCRLEHSIVKLGHCRTCPYRSVGSIPRPQECVVESRHRHDFDWAVYADDNVCTGVCECGVTAISYLTMVGP